jgi:hypothetical protein
MSDPGAARPPAQDQRADAEPLLLAIDAVAKSPAGHGDDRRPTAGRRLELASHRGSLRSKLVDRRRQIPLGHDVLALVVARGGLTKPIEDRALGGRESESDHLALGQRQAISRSRRHYDLLQAVSDRRVVVNRTRYVRTGHHV